MFAMQRVRTNEGWAALLMAAAVALASSGCGGTPVVEDAGPPVDPLGLHDWADAVVRSSGSRWVGERLLEHDPEPRPESALRAVSSRAELHVHAPEGVPDSTVASALRGLEAMHDMLAVEGWPAPLPDGGRGGTLGLDLYLVDETAPSRAGFDERALHTYMDRASTFARLSTSTSPSDLAACAGVAYAEALLLSADPAESESWRRATAAYLSERLTGRWGCEDEALNSQREAHEAYVAYADEEPQAGGALLLAALAERHEEQPGDFVRSLWDLASQRTWEGEGYRGSPDLWEALETVLRVSHDPFATALETLALDRFLAGPRASTRAPAWARRLGPDALPDATLRMSTDALRTHPPSTGELDPPMELEPTGTYYALVDVRSAPANSRLRVFLRGEFGVAWSLSVARLGASGEELGRMSAPPRRGTPRSYLPVELGAGTATVLVALTNLGREPRDALHFPVPNVDAARSEAHAARLVFELVSD